MPVPESVTISPGAIEDVPKLAALATEARLTAFAVATYKARPPAKSTLKAKPGRPSAAGPGSSTLTTFCPSKWSPDPTIRLSVPAF
jgi:hypothetical protein